MRFSGFLEHHTSWKWSWIRSSAEAWNFLEVTARLWKFSSCAPAGRFYHAEFFEARPCAPHVLCAMVRATALGSPFIVIKYREYDWISFPDLFVLGDLKVSFRIYKVILRCFFSDLWCFDFDQQCRCDSHRERTRRIPT